MATRARASADPSFRCTSFAKSTRTQCARTSRPGSDRCASHATSPGTALARRTSAAVTASAAVVNLEGIGWQTWRFGQRSWQAEAWRLYDLTGQLRFVAGWQANSVSRCRLYVAEVDDSGEPGEETEDPDIAVLAAVPLGQGPAKDEALRMLAIDLFVPGEAYVVVESEAADNGDDRWMVVTGRQITRTGDQIVVRRPQIQGGGDMLYRPGVDLIIRVHTPHPADADEPDSPTRSALPDLREIEALRKREFAELDSRLAGAGLLLLGSDIDFPRGPDEPPGAEGFAQLLQKTMATSLRDRSSAAALVPLIATVSPDSIDKIKHLTFWSELSEQLLPLREAAVRSLAQSLDVPAEILLGISDTNHWNAWALNDDAIRTQIVPVLSRIADALTTGYLRGALEVMGEDPDSYAFAFDTSPLTAKPNRVQDALQYYGAGVISEAAAIEGGAWRDDQRPDEKERLRRLAERLVLGAPSLAADPVLRELIGIGPPPAEILEEEDEPGQEDQPPEPEPEEEGPPGTEDDAENAPAARQEAAVAAVANLAMVRAMSLAGGRLVPHTKRDLYDGTPRHQLHTHVGPVDRGQADKVLAGAWDDLTHADLAVDVRALRGLLHEFAAALLCLGLPYDPAALRDTVATALRVGVLAPPLRVAA